MQCSAQDIIPKPVHYGMVAVFITHWLYSHLYPKPQDDVAELQRSKEQSEADLTKQYTDLNKSPLCLQTNPLLSLTLSPGLQSRVFCRAGWPGANPASFVPPRLWQEEWGFAQRWWVGRDRWLGMLLSIRGAKGQNMLHSMCNRMLARALYEGCWEVLVYDQ